ncbi:response regulator [soil metagenome]
MIQILVLAGQPLVRAAFRALFASSRDMRVVGGSTNIDEALHCIRAYGIDVVVLAVDGAMSSVADVCRLEAARAGRLVCIMAAESATLARHLLDRGVRGIVSGTAVPEEAFACIRCVSDGGIYLGSAVAQQLALHERRDRCPFDALSPREWQIMRFSSQGDSPQSIARRLCLSPKTVSTYRARAFRKLGARNDVDMLRMADRRGLLTTFGECGTLRRRGDRSSDPRDDEPITSEGNHRINR